MSNKIDIAEVAATLQALQFPSQTVAKVLEDLNAKLAELEADKPEPEPKAKQRHVIIVSDPEGKLGKDPLTGWVIQIPENESDATALERVIRSGHDFNSTKKGRLYPAKTIGEVFENVPRKFFKNSGVTVKTKLAAYAFPTDNVMPEAPSV